MAERFSVERQVDGYVNRRSWQQFDVVPLIVAASDSTAARVGPSARNIPPGWQRDTSQRTGIAGLDAAAGDSGGSEAAGVAFGSTGTGGDRFGGGTWKLTATNAPLTWLDATDPAGTTKPT
ncbi:MAG TPA: hypothetical protein VGQ37_11230 [Vicinamibacterales bacterium]|nr:hypothetical protein [Vicinamibacterales bacterium]